MRWTDYFENEMLMAGLISFPHFPIDLNDKYYFLSGSFLSGSSFIHGLHNFGFYLTFYLFINVIKR